MVPLRHYLGPRFPLLMTAVALGNRFHWLRGQPFEESSAVTVPWPTMWLFALGAAGVISLWLWPWPWRRPQRLAAVVLVTTPYVMYVTWVLSRFDFARVQSTVFDLSLIPVLVAWSWGNSATAQPVAGTLDPEPVA